MYEAAKSSADAPEVDFLTIVRQDRASLALCAAKDETSVEIMGRMFCCNFLRKS
jgi:hypothetical protein